MRLLLFLAALLAGHAMAQAPQPFADLQSAVDAAMADALSKTGAAVRVKKSESVTWRDASLGCPEPGRMYGQALVPGYRIRLHAGSREFDYHASEKGALVLCPPGRAKRPLPEGRS